MSVRNIEKRYAPIHSPADYDVRCRLRDWLMPTPHLKPKLNRLLCLWSQRKTNAKSEMTHCDYSWQCCTLTSMSPPVRAWLTAAIMFSSCALVNTLLWTRYFQRTDVDASWHKWTTGQQRHETINFGGQDSGLRQRLHDAEEIWRPWRRHHSQPLKVE